MVHTVFDDINSIYNTTGYMDRYSLDVWAALIICLLFAVATTYFFIMNNLQPIKADWLNQRCSPSVIPFAGLINKDPGTTVMEFTAKNFAECTQGILRRVAAIAFQPFYTLLQNLGKIFTEFGAQINSIRTYLTTIRDNVRGITGDVMGRISTMFAPIIRLVLTLRTVLQKVVGTLAATTFTMLGSYLTLKSLLFFIMNSIITIILILTGIIAVWLVIACIPLFGSWAIPLAAANILIMAAIMVPFIMLQIFMDKVAKAGGGSYSFCFAGDTPMQLLDQPGSRPLKDVHVGDKLAQGGGQVTAVLKCTTAQQAVYQLYGITVSGEHRVYFKNRWLQVKQHPDRQLLPEFAEPFLYCLNTTAKSFTVGATLFSDWDDLDARVRADLVRNCCNKGYLPPDFTGIDLHGCLENGLIGETRVMLNSGETRQLSEVQVHDVLQGPGPCRVLAVVSILGADVPVYTFDLTHGRTLTGTGNLQLRGPHLYLEQPVTEFEVNCLDLYGRLSKTSPPVLYQLLTSTGTFVANGVTVCDYNSGVDKYLNDT